jgi:hypothetical protein
MTGKVTLTLDLDETRLLWPQTTRGVVTLENSGPEPIERINKEIDQARCALSVTAVETGEMTLFAEPPPPGGPFYDLSLAPGQKHEERFTLSNRARLAGPGLYSVRAYCTWEEGTVSSVPVRVEVLAAAPRFARLATTSGGPAGNVLCAWINAEGDAGTLWLSTLSTSGGGGFAATTRLCPVPLTATPVLSVPPLGPSSRQYVAWAARGSLGYAIHASGQVTTGSIDLGAEHLVATPLLEAAFAPDVAPYAEALLIGEAAGGYQLRVARITGASGTVGEPVLCEGPMPRWAHTAYRADESRCTTFLAPRWLKPGEPAVSVQIGAWSPGEPPEATSLVANWPGVLIAADQCLAADGTAYGAAIINLGADKPRYALQRWRVTADDRFEEGTLTWIAWSREDPIARAVLRVNAQQDLCALLLAEEKGAGFFRCDARGQVVSFNAVIEATAAPVDVFFVDWTTAAILYTEPRCGLRILSTAPHRRPISPAGAAV